MSYRVDLKDIGEWLAANTSFVLGDTLWTCFQIQDAPERCAVIANNAGGATYQTARNRIDWRLQIVARAPVWSQAQNDAHEFFEFLFQRGTNCVNLPLASPKYRIESIKAIGSPAYIGQDEKNRFQFSSNYELKIFEIK